MMESNMPPYEDVRAEHVMRIEVVSISKYPSAFVDTYIDFVHDGVRGVVRGEVFTISNPTTQGYLPTKIWFAEGELNFLFYCSPTLPPAARPFGDQPMYCLVVESSTSDVLEYDHQLRVLIDQVVVDGTLWFVFVFGQAQYDEIVRKGDQ